MSERMGFFGPRVGDVASCERFGNHPVAHDIKVGFREREMTLAVEHGELIARVHGASYSSRPSPRRTYELFHGQQKRPPATSRGRPFEWRRRELNPGLGVTQRRLLRV